MNLFMDPVVPQEGKQPHLRAHDALGIILNKKPCQANAP